MRAYLWVVLSVYTAGLLGLIGCVALLVVTT